MDEIEEVYEIEVVVKLVIPINNLPIVAVNSLEEISSPEAVEGKLIQLHIPPQIKKDLEGEIVEVKSGVYENLAMGEIVKLKKISLGIRKWEEIS